MEGIHALETQSNALLAELRQINSNFISAAPAFLSAWYKETAEAAVHDQVERSVELGHQLPAMKSDVARVEREIGQLVTNELQSPGLWPHNDNRAVERLPDDVFQKSWKRAAQALAKPLLDVLRKYQYNVDELSLKWGRLQGPLDSYVAKFNARAVTNAKLAAAKREDLGQQLLKQYRGE